MSTAFKKRVAVGVGGIFHAERMSAALAKQGFDVELFPTFPRFKIKNFDREKTFPYVFGEIIIRLSQKIHQENRGDLLKMQLYGKWFANQLAKRQDRPFDFLISWSSFGLEAFQQNPRAFKILVRDSAHIKTQVGILESEFKKNGLPFPDRSICVRRELQEYLLADRIIILSEFAKRSFLEHGIPENKLILLPLGADGSLFYPEPNRKITRPLQVVYFGNLSIQKGVTYLIEAFEKIPKEKAELTLIGSVQPELKRWVGRMNHFKMLPHLDHERLGTELRKMDLFVFPSLHDGFGAVVPQALSCGLYTIATNHCGAADLITPGVNGEIIPAGSAEAIRQTVLKFSENLDFLSDRRRSMGSQQKSWSWENYETRVGEIFNELLGNIKSKIA